VVSPVGKVLDHVSRQATPTSRVFLLRVVSGLVLFFCVQNVWSCHTQKQEKKRKADIKLFIPHPDSPTPRPHVGQNSPATPCPLNPFDYGELVAGVHPSYPRGHDNNLRTRPTHCAIHAFPLA
jgi:hypothetical protein